MVCTSDDERAKRKAQEKVLSRQRPQVAMTLKHEPVIDAKELQEKKPVMDLQQRLTSVEREQSRGGVSRSKKHSTSQKESQVRQTNTVGSPSSAKSTLTIGQSAGVIQQQTSASESSQSPADTRLSLYMYPRRKTTGKSVSPSFDLLQNPATLGDARKLLRFESDLALRKTELCDLEKGKSHVETGIAEEKSLLGSYKHTLEVSNDEYNRL